MIDQSAYPSPANWQLDAVRLNLLQVQVHAAPGISVPNLINRLTTLGFRRIRRHQQGPSLQFPSDFPVLGEINITKNRTSGIWSLYGFIRLSPFKLAMLRFPELAAGNRTSLDGSANFFAPEVIQEHGQSALHDMVASSLRSTIADTGRRMANALGSAFDAEPQELSSLLHYSLGGIEVCWDLPCHDPFALAASIRPALAAVLKHSRERLYSESPVLLETIATGNGWGMSGLVSSGLRVQLYVKSPSFVRCESAYDGWRALSREIGSTKLEQRDLIGNLLEISQSIAVVESARWGQVFRDCEPGSQHGTLSEFSALAASVIRDPERLRAFLGVILERGFVQSTAQWRRPIATLVKRGILVRVARGRYRLAPKWRHLQKLSTTEVSVFQHLPSGREATDGMSLAQRKEHVC